MVAAQVEEQILASGWPVGTLIGTEDELVASLGVGRGVLREAARLLEDHHIARMRRGRGGGLMVIEPDVAAVTRAVSIYLESLRVSSEDVFGARRVLDLFAVQLAADRLDEAGLTRLRALLEREAGADDARFAAGSHRRMHGAIADVTGNPVLAVFVEALSLLDDDRRALAGRHHGAPARRAAAAVHRAHEAIVEAVIAGDGLLASHRMLKHLTSLQVDLRRRAPGPGSDPAAPATVTPAPVRERAPVSIGPASPALAEGILADIIGRDWPVGRNLGSEAELLARYEVGRASLREAVRLLEHHGAVEMRRGPGGGLIVRAPDGEAAMRVVELHLEYRGIRPVDVFAVREAMEMATLDLAIERLDGEAEDRLGAALARHRDPLAADFGDAAHHFHVVLAELSGNQTMQLFTAILTRITARHLPPAAQVAPEVLAEHRALICSAHDGIVEAMVAGDTALARRRMRLHLRALECASA